MGFEVSILWAAGFILVFAMVPIDIQLQDPCHVVARMLAPAGEGAR